jgi:hypothetical protein
LIASVYDTRMKTLLHILVVGGLMLLFLGCDDEPTPPVSGQPAAPAAQAPAKPPLPEVPAIEPEYAIAIEESTSDPKQYTVTWSAKVPTGGWTMKTDNVLVEEYMGKMAARIYVTLEQPNPSDTVTQAVETVTGKHEAGTVKIERVEFSVRRHVRGIKYDSPALYSVVKSIKYPY